MIFLVQFGINKPNYTRKIMWVLINNIHEKHNHNNKF